MIGTRACARTHAVPVRPFEFRQARFGRDCAPNAGLPLIPIDLAGHRSRPASGLRKHRVGEALMQRYGMLIGIHPEKIDEYRRLHAAVWPTVMEQIKRSNISNYTIYLREPENLLFSHFEYHGDNFEADMAAMARDPQTQRWWTLCSPCQAPLHSRAPGEHWALMQEVFHID
jgi:L-rhamnose mutarotase